MTAVLDAPRPAEPSPHKRRLASIFGRRPQATSAASAGLTTVTIGLVITAAWLLTFAFVLSPLQEHADQTRLYAKLRQVLADPPPPVAVAKAGTPLVLLDAPNAGVHRVVVVEGTASSTLRQGPGHRMGSALPGQEGVSVVFGRSVTFGAPFAHIGRLKSGDAITAVTNQGTFHFRVADVRRAGDPIPPSLLTGAHLTLVSSEGVGWRKGWAPDRALYVDAMLDGKSAPSPPRASVAAAPQSQPMQGDNGALVPLVLWLQALLIVLLALAWAVRRWGLWQAWLVGVPVVSALAWATSDSLFALLPNLN